MLLIDESHVAVIKTFNLKKLLDLTPIPQILFRPRISQEIFQWCDDSTIIMDPKNIKNGLDSSKYLAIHKS